jgi:thiamine biosynthesis lipoprotein
MGTTAEVRVAGVADEAAALNRAFAALTLVDDQMSLWKESDLTQLNRDGFRQVPPELLAVVRQALDVARASLGAFDPTVEPLVRATGGVGGAHRTLGDDERRALLLRVGAAKVHVDDAARAIRLEGNAALDLGGIAKGYAADLALEALCASGASDGLVDLGGSSIGVFGEPLTAAVRDPETKGGAPWASFVVRDESLSTSAPDQKPGHILDPRTGLPATGVLAATVVAATGVEADALSTAVFVLGPGEGLPLLARRGAAGFVLLRRAGRRVMLTTPGFSRRYHLVTAPDMEVQE